MTILVGDWVKPSVKQAVTFEIIDKNKNGRHKGNVAEISPDNIFKVRGIYRDFQWAEIIPLSQSAKDYKGALYKYSVDLRLLTKIEGKQLKMLQNLYNDSKELLPRRNN